MDSISMLIVVAIAAWIGQIGLSFFQIRAFNRMLQAMAKKGTVKIGRTQSKWKKRTIVVLSESPEHKIIDAKVLKGVTVFARPETLDSLIGDAFPFSNQKVSSLDKGTQEALKVAFQTE
ncbi:transcriptional regulator [Vibrio sp. 10N.286.49.C2]|nr:transcriptional regulator [Vibrio sp. 10N.286.49.C2]PMH44096.1 transcriptional regulator [Vibrio sp. 10N.286.49.B1]PMH83746.1 transcriptional regulator [Vibrio sp. 10N.286.48.B7]